MNFFLNSLFRTNAINSGPTGLQSCIEILRNQVGIAKGKDTKTQLEKKKKIKNSLVNLKLLILLFRKINLIQYIFLQ